MTFRIQVFYGEAGLFMNTNHKSDDLEALKSLANSDGFRGVRIRIVDDSDNVLFEPQLNTRDGPLSLTELANVLGVPVIERPEFESLGQTMKVSCTLEAHHVIHGSAEWELDLESAEGRRRLEEWSELNAKARIITLHLSEDEAERIVNRIWPGEGLLGATCGKTFSIETPEHVAAVNEVLAPKISINFNEQHEWRLHTWPIKDNSFLLVVDGSMNERELMGLLVSSFPDIMPVRSGEITTVAILRGHYLSVEYNEFAEDYIREGNNDPHARFRLRIECVPKDDTVTVEQQIALAREIAQVCRTHNLPFVIAADFESEI